MEKPNPSETEDDESFNEGMEGVPKISMINPGFRDIVESNAKSKSSGPKLKSNRLDRKNRVYLILAILVVLAIIGVLEYKQMRDASLEQWQVKPMSLFRW